MRISVHSAKAKGRRLQAWTRDLILTTFPFLEPDDVKSTSMGASDEDVQLSPAARKVMPFAIECKSHKAFAIYSIYEQATGHKGSNHEPLAIIKGDRKKPLVVVDAEYFIKLIGEVYHARAKSGGNQ